MEALIKSLKNEILEQKRFALSLCDKVDEKKAQRKVSRTDELEEEIDSLRTQVDKEYQKLYNLRNSLFYMLRAIGVESNSFTPEDELKWEVNKF